MGPKKNIDQLIEKFKKKYPKSADKEQNTAEKRKKIKKESKSDKSPSQSHSEKSKKSIQNAEANKKAQTLKQDYLKEQKYISICDDSQSNSVVEIIPNSSQASIQQRLQQTYPLQQIYDPRSIYTSKWAKANDATMLNSFKHCGFIEKITSFFCSAYIRFREESSVEKALAMNGKYFQGKKIKVQRKLKQKPKKKAFSEGKLENKLASKQPQKQIKSSILPIKFQENPDEQKQKVHKQEKVASPKVLQQQSSPSSKLQVIQPIEKDPSDKNAETPKMAKKSPIRKEQNPMKKKVIRKKKRSQSKSDEN